MSDHKIYYVTHAKPKPGKSAEAARWWTEVGKALFEALPGVVSVKAYITQFGLSGGHMGLSTGQCGVEIWQELENYAVFDKWDAACSVDASQFDELFDGLREYYDTGASRVVGDWANTQFKIGVSKII